MSDKTEYEIALEKTSSPHQLARLEVELLNDLIETGAHIADVPSALSAISRAFDSAGDVRAAEAIGIILGRLPGGREGCKLRAALLGTIDGDGADQARKFGMTKQAWHQGINRLKTRLFRKNVDRRPLCKGR